MGDALNPADVIERVAHLRGRVAVITGGSRGIGRAIALAFSACGADVVVVSRSLPACEEVAEEIRAAGGRALAHALDIAQLGDHAGLIDAAVQTFGGLDILVNNAGVLRPHVVDRLTEDEYDEIFATNTKGMLFLCKQAFPALRQSSHASVINVGALGALAPMAGIGAYSASKAAALAWTKVLANEWGVFGIRVNALVPGPVSTEMILPRDAAARESFVESMRAQTLLGRVADPAEMVGAAVFLAGDASSFVTGHHLLVDGGMSAKSTA